MPDNRAQVGPPAPNDIARPRLAAVIWVAGSTLLCLITLTALFGLPTAIGQMWPGITVGSGAAWVAALVAAFVAVLAGLMMVVDWAARPGRSTWVILVNGLALVAVIRLVVIALVHPALVSDWLFYHHLAVAISTGGSWFSIVPTGYPIMLASLYAVLGPYPIIGEFLNLALALWTAAMLFVLARHRFGNGAAAAAVYLFAIVPSQVLMTTVLGTEVAYGAFIATAVAVAVVGGRRAAPWTAALGVVLALSQYVRSTSDILLPAFVAFLWLQHRSAATALRRSVLLVAVFLLVMIPAIVVNVAAGAGATVATSRYGGWSLLIGLNQQKIGHYNGPDIKLVGLTAGTVAWERRATRLALHRLVADPSATAQLVVRKFPLFWGADDYGALWVALPPGNVAQPMGRTEIMASQIGYAAVLVLALLGLLRWRGRRGPTELLIVLLIGTVAVLHSFVEIQTRYHSYLVPLLCVLAAGEMVVLLKRGAHQPSRAGEDDAAALMEPEPHEAISNEGDAQADQGLLEGSEP